MRIDKRLVMPIVFLVGVPFIAGACDDGESAGPEAGVDVDDLAEDDTIDDNEFGIYDGDELDQFEGEDELVGQLVTASGTVDRIIEPGKTFTIGEDVAEGGLLIAMPPQLKEHRRGHRRPCRRARPGPGRREPKRPGHPLVWGYSRDDSLVAIAALLKVAGS